MRCEGYRRTGGAFTLGPVKWEQCKNDAVVMMEFKHDGEVQTLPACRECLGEAHSAEESNQVECVFYATPISEGKPCEAR